MPSTPFHSIQQFQLKRIVQTKPKHQQLGLSTAENFAIIYCTTIYWNLDMQIDRSNVCSSRARPFDPGQPKIRRNLISDKLKNRIKGSAGPWLEPRVRPPSVSEWQDRQANNVITLSVPTNVEIRCSNVCTRACVPDIGDDRALPVYPMGSILASNYQKFAEDVASRILTRVVRYSF